MKLVAINSVQGSDGELVAPGETFDIDEATGKTFIEGGFAKRKTKEVAADDLDDDGRESGANTAPDPATTGKRRVN